MVFTTFARRALYSSLKTSCPSHSSHLPESSRNFRGAPSYTEQNSFLPSHVYSDVRWKFSNIIFFILFHQQFCWNRSWGPPSFKFCCRRWYRRSQQAWSRMVGGEIANCFFHWVCFRVFDQSSVEDAAFWKRRRTRNIYQSWVDGRFHIVSRCRPLIFLTARTIFIFYGVVNISTCSFVNVCFDAHVGVIYDVSMLRNGPRYVTLW